MAYIALYRKFRPPVFDEVRGQDHIVTTLRNQIMTGRVGHAYLFVGTRGTGKTTVAKILARSVNCENPQNGSPCGECEVCRAIETGAALNVVELDAASNNGVDEVRQIIDEIDYSPAIGRYRVYIIDEVHMFTTAAFNALLKTLEEPPEHVIFILATTEVQRIPVTILSRCQRYDFRRISLEEITSRLRQVSDAENIKVTDEALSYIARAADGAMRDGLSLLDQCAAFHYGEELTLDMVLDVLGAVEVEVYGALMDALLAGDVGASLEQISAAVADGRDLVQYVNDFIWYLRNLMLVNAAGDASNLKDISSENRAYIEKKAKEADLEIILRYISIFSELSSRIRYSTQKRVMVEVALIRLLRPQTKEADEELSARVRTLENRSEADEKKLRSLLDGIESGEIAVSASGAARDDSNERIAKERAREVAKALPEEVKQVIERWREVRAKLRNGGLIRVIDMSTLCVDGAGNLVISTSVPYENGDPDMDRRRIDELTDAIRQVVDREVSIRFEETKNGNSPAPGLTSVDDLRDAFAGINMDVGLEEQPTGTDVFTG